MRELRAAKSFERERVKRYPEVSPGFEILFGERQICSIFRSLLRARSHRRGGLALRLAVLH